MKPGTILATVRSSNAIMTKVCIVVSALCIVVIALHGRYIYNLIGGPFPLDAAAATSGARVNVRGAGDLVDTSVVATTALSYRGIELSKDVSANFRVMALAGKQLVVRVPPDFTGRVVEGELVPLTPELRTALGGDLDAYPRMLDTTTMYRVGISLPLVISLLLLVPAGWLATSCARTARHPEADPDIVALGRFGDVSVVLADIEGELAAAGDDAKVNELWIAPTWLVSTDAGISIIHRSDVVGVAQIVDVASGRAKHRIAVWQRGKPNARELAVSEDEARTILAKVAIAMPWAVIDDGPAFAERWKRERETIERETETPEVDT